MEDDITFNKSIEDLNIILENSSWHIMSHDRQVQRAAFPAFNCQKQLGSCEFDCFETMTGHMQQVINYLDVLIAWLCYLGFC